eukprot:10687738-Alexandrium_andersonii.AAC.1
MMDCARSFLEVVAPAHGLGLQSAQEAFTGAAGFGPDPQVAFATSNSRGVCRVPQGWPGPEEMEFFEPAPARAE